MADIARIKGNIAKMIAQNAPEADIDAYVAAEGVTLDDLRAAPKAAAPAEADPYKAAARKRYEDLKAKGIDTAASPGRLAAQGMTLNAADEILAAALTPFEMGRNRTFNPLEGYRHAKAMEDLSVEEGRKQSGIAGTAAEVLGGAVTGGGLAGAGLTAGRFLSPASGLLARSGAALADGAAMGAVAGAMEGNTAAERGTNALTGGLLGGAISGATPGILAVGGGLLSPFISNVRARSNPQGYANTQVARAAIDSGKTSQAIAQEVADANAAGQPFTVADALGNPGQRMLSTVARARGPGRTDVVDFLSARQAGQGARLTQQVDDALGASGTARKTSAQLIEAARRESAPFYQKALTQKGIWNDRIQQFFDDPITKRGLREGIEVQRLESLASGKKFNPKDYAITGFDEAGDPIISGVPNMRTINLIKKGWDNVLEGYRDSTTGRLMLDERGRAIDAVRRSFLNEVDAVNPDYKVARQIYAGPASVNDAIRRGSQAATRGRAEDNIAQFSAMPSAQQQGHRIGYADKLAEGFERGAEGVNKARVLTSDKAKAELGAQSLYQGPNLPGQPDQLARRIARENTMFETRNQALGGSRTADNLADEGAMGIDPTVVGQLLSGNISGAARSLLAAGSNFLSGNTPEVRKAVADILLQRGQNVTPQNIQRILDETMKRLQRAQQTARMLGRGGAGGVAVAPAATSEMRR